MAANRRIHVAPAVVIDRAGPLPLYFQIATSIEQSIVRGDFPHAARLENEVAMAMRLGLSLQTVRRAIEILVEKGLLVRRSGVGTLVLAGFTRRRSELTSLHDQMTARSQNPTTRVLALAVEPVSDGVADSLGLAVGERVIHLRRVRSGDGVPVAILENWLPVSTGEITVDELERHGLYQLLRSRGLSISVAKQSIGARTSTGSERELLAMPESMPVLTAARTSYASDGTVVDVGSHRLPPRHPHGRGHRRAEMTGSGLAQLVAIGARPGQPFGRSECHCLEQSELFGGETVQGVGDRLLEIERHRLHHRVTGGAQLEQETAPISRMSVPQDQVSLDELIRQSAHGRCRQLQELGQCFRRHRLGLGDARRCPEFGRADARLKSQATPHGVEGPEEFLYGQRNAVEFVTIADQAVHRRLPQV